MSKTELAVVDRTEDALETTRRWAPRGPVSVLDLSESHRETLRKAAMLAAQSGLYAECGIATPEQAFVKMIQGVELGIPPTRALNEIYIVKGRIQIGSGVLASLVRMHPVYDYRVDEHSAEVCRIRFTEKLSDGTREDLGVSEFTIEDAHRAGLVRKGGVWEAHPRNMLFARAMSNGVKWHCPDVTNGPVYVEGELDDPVHARNVTPAAQTQPADPAPVVDLFGGQRQLVAPADLDVDELISWASDQVGPDAAEAILTAHRKAHGGDVIYEDFTDEVLAAVGGA